MKRLLGYLILLPTIFFGVGSDRALGVLVARTQLTTSEKASECAKRGIEYLKNAQSPNGVWSHLGNTDPNNPDVLFTTAMCVKTLMQCEVKRTDPHIQAGMKVLREQAQSENLKDTAAISLIIIVRSRYFGGAENKLTESLVKRLLSAQKKDGRWGAEIDSAVTDNYHTHLAILALVAASPRPFSQGEFVSAISRAEKAFRNSQKENGSWSLDQSRNDGKPTAGDVPMTCAGLQLIFFSAVVQYEIDNFKNKTNPKYPVPKLFEDQGALKAINFISTEWTKFKQGKILNAHVFRFLFSTEVACTSFHLKNLEDRQNWRELPRHNWYEIGAEYLIKQQDKNGAWQLDKAEERNLSTAYALLFLSKAEFVYGLVSYFGPTPRQP